MLKDLEQDTPEVNAKIDNKENNSGTGNNGPSGNASPVTPLSRPRNELDKIAAALATLSSRTSVFRERAAVYLKWYFDDESTALGYPLFVDWVRETSPAGAVALTIGELRLEWESAQVDAAGSFATSEPSLPKMLFHIRVSARDDGARIKWTDTTDDGVTPVASSQFNVQALLDGLGVVVYRNEFSGKRHIEGFEDFDELTDDALNALWLKAEALGLRTKTEYFSSVVRELARRDARNPVKDYFARTEWDRTPRLDTWLIDYAGAEDVPLNRAFGRLLLIAAVRRVRSPGTKFDQMIVLEGPQGAGKSSLALALADAVGPGLFEDSLLLGSDPKQVIELTRGKLIVEISELRGGTREVEAIKAMLSRKEDSARLSYGRETSHVPRQFVMMGTTNSKEYLLDPSGNRRFWPVEVGAIDLPGLRETAAQIWAEAAYREAAGEAITLPVELHAAAAAAQGERVVGDPIHYALSKELGDFGGTIDMDALYTIIGLDNEKRERREQRHLQAIGRAMTRLGWKNVRKRIGSGERVYVYTKQAAVEYWWSVDDATGKLQRGSNTVVGRSANVTALDERRAPGRRRPATPEHALSRGVPGFVPGFGSGPGTG